MNSLISSLTVIPGKRGNFSFVFYTQEEIYGTSYAVAYYLKEILKFDKKVYTVGTTGMVEELDELKIPHTGSGVGFIC